MTNRIQRANLQIAPVLYDLLENEIAPGTGVAAEDFWQGLSSILDELGPRNTALLAIRDDMQESIDTWHREHPGAGYDCAAYRTFLENIGYLLPEGEDFSIETTGVDEAITSVAGPQLVAPVINARFMAPMLFHKRGALNAPAPTTLFAVTRLSPMPGNFSIAITRWPPEIIARQKPMRL